LDWTLDTSALRAGCDTITAGRVQEAASAACLSACLTPDDQQHTVSPLSKRARYGDVLERWGSRFSPRFLSRISEPKQDSALLDSHQCELVCPFAAFAARPMIPMARIRELLGPDSHFTTEDLERARGELYAVARALKRAALERRKEERVAADFGRLFRFRAQRLPTQTSGSPRSLWSLRQAGPPPGRCCRRIHGVGVSRRRG